MEENYLEEKINPDDSEGKKSKILIFFAMAAVLVFLAFGTYWFQKKSADMKKDLARSQVEKKPAVESRIINENTEVVEKEIDDLEANKGILVSENYRINNINIGGNIMILPNEENKILKISNVKSNSFLDEKKDEVKLIVTWQTNKLAISEIEYAKNNGENPKIIKEDSYGFGHSATIVGLEPGKPYIYQIKCKDRWGNEEVSEHFGAYTSSKAVSVIDLIIFEMKKMFGWAMK